MNVNFQLQLYLLQYAHPKFYKFSRIPQFVYFKYKLSLNIKTGYPLKLNFEINYFRRIPLKNIEL